MKMLRIAVYFLTVLTLALPSCKHQKAASGGDQNKPSLMKGMMSEKDAKEEEQFVGACVLKMTGNYKKAAHEFEDITEKNPKNAAAHYEAAGVYQILGENDRALNFAKEAASLKPDNIWYQLRYAELLQLSGNQEAAAGIYKKTAADHPGNVDILFRYAGILQRTGEHRDALNVYADIEKQTGPSDTLLHCKIISYRALKNDAAEADAIRKMIAAYPAEEQYHKMLCKYYENKGNTEESKKAFQNMLAVFPYSTYARLHLAAVYLNEKNDGKAFAEACTAFITSDGLNDKLNYLNQWYPVSDSTRSLSAGRMKEADTLSSILVRAHAESAEAWMWRGEFLVRGNRLMEAHKAYSTAVKITGKYWTSWNRLLEINDKLGDDNLQIADCRTAMEYFPTQPLSYYYCGKAYYRQKNHNDAITMLDMGINYLFDNPVVEKDMELMLMRSYRATADHEKADKYAEKILQREPSNETVTYEYCLSLVQRKFQLYNAQQKMTALVEKHPDNASYCGLLGRIEYWLADYTKAKEYADKALSLNPDNAEYNELRGDIAFRLNNTEEALKYWNKAKAAGGDKTTLERKISNKSLNENE
ncbi:MAG: tetratricopeptide repeat protein [Bacteroidia bacterium]